MKNPKVMLRIVLACAAAIALGTLACAPVEEEARRPSVKDDKDRKKAPEFALKDSAGKVVHLSDYKGKVVLLDFWATWCGPCNIEIPWFEDFQRKYKDRGFEVVGVSMDDDGWKAVTPFLAEKKINYRTLLGNDLTADLYGGLEALPTTFVIDRDGRIASVHVGLSGKKEFEDAIEQLLDAAAPRADNRAHRANGADAERRADSDRQGG